MNPDGYISVAFRSLPREIKEVITAQDREGLDALLVKAKFSHATKMAAEYYFEQHSEQRPQATAFSVGNSA